MFATDRDLLVLEPRLFHDVSWSAQKLAESAASASVNSLGSELTIPGADFPALRVRAGFVALVAGTPVEVLSVPGTTVLEVSRLRASPTDPRIPVAPGSGLKASVSSFGPQIRVVHDQLLRLLGIEPGAASADGRPSESDITNPEALALAEALGTLNLVFSSAAALVGADSPAWAKAQMYRERYASERRRVVAEIDLDGDGVPDVSRRPNVMTFIRA